MNFKKIMILGLSLLTVSQIVYGGEFDEQRTNKKPKFFSSVNKFFKDVGDKLTKEFKELGLKSPSKKTSEYQVLVEPSSRIPGIQKAENITPQLSDLPEALPLKSATATTKIEHSNIMNVSVYIISQK